MLEAAANLFLVVIAIAATTLWISGVANSDGECHYDDCDRCPYEGGCPWERRR